MVAANVPTQQDRLSSTTTTAASDNRLAAATAGGLAEAVCGIGVIVFGVGLLCGDSAVVACIMQFSNRRGRTTTTAVPFGGGLGAETMAGVAGIVLGILTLIGVAPLA